MEIADRVYEIFDITPWQQAGKMRDQATDAACSVPSNIAEGASRRTEREKYRFLEVALGSSFELQTRLLIVRRRGWADAHRLTAVLVDLELEQKRIAALMNTMER